MILAKSGVKHHEGHLRPLLSVLRLGMSTSLHLIYEESNYRESVNIPYLDSSLLIELLVCYSQYFIAHYLTLFWVNFTAASLSTSKEKSKSFLQITFFLHNKHLISGWRLSLVYFPCLAWSSVHWNSRKSLWNFDDFGAVILFTQIKSSNYFIIILFFPAGSDRYVLKINDEPVFACQILFAEKKSWSGKGDFIKNWDKMRGRWTRS